MSIIYADYSSSGRSLQFIEDYISREVLPAFGDITCTSTVTGLQSMIYNKESKEILRAALHATDDDEIIFCSNPCEKLAHLCLQTYNSNKRTQPNENILQDFADNEDDKKATSNNIVLFVSISEPYCNLKPWIDAGAQVERVIKNKDGFLDLDELEKQLAMYDSTKHKLIGLFPAASRITGIHSDDVATTILLHQYGALSLWDYNMTISSTLVDTNPPLPGAQKDAIFFSGNKLIGGVQASGILVIKKILADNYMPNADDTVNIVNIVRAGLAMQLRETLGVQAISIRTEKICKIMLAHIRTIPEIVLLGPPCSSAKRVVSTMCFLVRHPRGAYLHHKFIVAILNDVFGIQATAHNLINEVLGISEKLAVEFEKLLNDDSLHVESIRPGYVRLTLPFFMSEGEVNFILESLKMVATEGWKLLPQYFSDEITGEWRHHTNLLQKERKSLNAVRYSDGRMLFTDRRISGAGAFPQNFSDCLQFARNSFQRARKIAQRSTSGENLYLKMPKDSAERLRWYMLPGEAHELLLGHSKKVKLSVPFDPHKLSESPSIINMLRHNSLSALDICRLKSRSLTGTPFLRTNSSHSPPSNSNSPTPIKFPECASPPCTSPIVRFSLGGEVTCVANFVPQQITNLIASEGTTNRIRCHSWGPTTPPVLLSPQTRFNLGFGPKERSSSCSSQNDLYITGSSENIYRSSSTVGEDLQDFSSKQSSDSSTSELKAEIRDVINKVEDAIENSDSLGVCNANLNALSHSVSIEEKKHESVSIEEVKSELIEAVQAIKDLIPADAVNNSPVPIDETTLHNKLKPQRHSDTSHEIKPKEYADKPRSESFPRPNAPCNLENSSQIIRPYTGAISKLIDPKETSSQDSGINLCFHDIEEKHKIKCSQNRNRAMSAPEESDESESQDSTKRLPSKSSSDKNCDEIASNSINQSPKVLRRQPNLINRPSIDGENDENSSWHNLPKEIWQKVAEAIDEFDMIKDGDRILIGVSGSSSSICLLHGLRQFIRARGLHVDFGAVTIAEDLRIDPRCLMFHMKSLGVEYFFEQGNSGSEMVKHKLSLMARRRGYNTLALGNSLDKLANDFLSSLLLKGRLYVSPAYKKIDQLNIKVVRPFIYVREKLLEDLCSQKNIPSRPSKCAGVDAVKSILTVQEVINPNVYENILNAVKPLLCLKLDYIVAPDEIMKLSNNC